jgi:SAM-dependent methyltransferase
MSDQRRVAPAPDSLDSGAAAAEVHPVVSSNPEAARTPTPPADVAPRRRGRLALRIPDDEVARPPSVEPEPPLSETNRHNAEATPIAADDSAALRPTRIITINPPEMSASPGGDLGVAPPSPGDDGFDDEPTPLVRRILRTPAPAAPAAPLAATLSFPPPPAAQPATASSPPAAASPAAASPPAASPPAASSSVASSSAASPPAASSSVASSPAPSARAPSFPPVSAQRAPAPVPVPASPPPVIPAVAPALDTRTHATEGELSLDDLVALDTAPSTPAVVATLPAVRPRLPSHPQAPPTSKKGSPAPAERPSKPPLVIVPPHMGNVVPQQPEGAPTRRKGRFWWEDLFNDDYLRANERLTEEQLLREVHFIEESLGIERGGAVLDLACGTGQHAIELARRGYRVVAFDLSLPMLARAGDEAQERNAQLNFVQGDMREMTFVEQFDGVYCWNTSFGFFEEEKNALVVDRIHDALKSGGLFLLDVVNRDFIVPQSPSLAWFEGDGCVCMDEMVVDFITSRMRVKRTMMLDDGRSREIEFSIRVYSLHELGKMLHDHGFKVCEVSGRIATPGVFFGHESPRTIILAEKR